MSAWSSQEVFYILRFTAKNRWVQLWHFLRTNGDTFLGIFSQSPETEPWANFNKGLLCVLLNTNTMFCSTQARGNVFGESVTFRLLLLRVFPLASSAFKQSLHWISCEPLNDIVHSSFLQHHIGPASATAATSDGQLAQNSSASVAPGVHQVSFCRPNWAQAEIE